MLDQLVEEHAVEARGGRHDDVGDAEHSRDFLHAPGDLRGSAEPPVDADAGIGDGAKSQSFELRV